MTRAVLPSLITLLACGCVGPWSTDTDAGELAGACSSCHMSEYKKTQSPVHGVNKYPTECETCHRSETDWHDTRFDGHGDFFTLDGKHAELSCVACHAATGVPGSACVDCHRKDYDATTSPAHAAAGYSTDCKSCHNTSGWGGALVDHSQFFPFTGPHRGMEKECSTCHNVKGDYSKFTCFGGGCHQQGKTDGKHRDVDGYRYDSAECYRCHPTGRAEDDD